MMNLNHAVRSLFVDTTDYSHTSNQRAPSHTLQPQSLSPMCGWQKSETPSPISKIAAMPSHHALTPTKSQRMCPTHRAASPRSASLTAQSSPNLPRTLEPFCWSVENSPAKLDCSSERSDALLSARGAPSSCRDDIGETISFRVPDIKLNDLYDWDEKLSEKPGKAEGPASVCPRGMKINLNEEDIALFRRGNRVYAINAKCPHQGGPLEMGDIEELAGPCYTPSLSGLISEPAIGVRCPWHGWTFNLQTGATVRPIGRLDRSASVYKTSVEPDGSIIIGFSVFNSAYFNDVME